MGLVELWVVSRQFSLHSTVYSAGGAHSTLDTSHVQNTEAVHASHVPDREAVYESHVQDTETVQTSELVHEPVLSETPSYRSAFDTESIDVASSADIVALAEPSFKELGRYRVYSGYI